MTGESNPSRKFIHAIPSDVPLASRLAKSEEQLRMALDGSKLALWDWDIRSGKVRLSENWNVLLGGAPTLMTCSVKDLFAIVHPHDIAEVEALTHYNSDLAEDKQAVFGARRDVRLALPALTVLVSGLAFDRDRLAAAASDPLLLATDAAEALVVEGMPFRAAHEQVAAEVRSGTFDSARTARQSITARAAPGPAAVSRALLEARARFSP